MTLAAGSLKDRIRIERQSANVEAGTGHVEDVWSSLATRRASILPTKSDDKNAASGLYAEATTEIRFRYDASLSDLDETDRIVDLLTSAVYEIVGQPINERNENRVYKVMAVRRSR